MFQASTDTEIDVPNEKALTDAAADEVRTLLEQSKGNRTRIVGLREAQERTIEVAKQEIVSLNKLLGLLDATEDKYLAELNQPPAVLPGKVEQDQQQVSPTEHKAVWDGADPPETGMFATVPDLCLDPDQKLERIGALHDAQDAREGVAR